MDDQVLQHQVNEQKAAVSASKAAAVRTIAWTLGLIWLVILVAAGCAIDPRDSRSIEGFLYLISCGLIGAPIIVLVGEGIGRVAWWSTSQSTIRPKTLAIGLALVLALTVLGWLLVVFDPDSAIAF